MTPRRWAIVALVMVLVGLPALLAAGSVSAQTFSLDLGECQRDSLPYLDEQAVGQRALDGRVSDPG